MIHSFRNKYFLFILVLCVITLFHVWNTQDTFTQNVFYTGSDHLGTRDPDVTCIFPLPNPFDASILSYIKPAIRLVCDNKQYMLTYIDEDGFLRLNYTGFEEAGYRISDLKCYYATIIRKDDYKISLGPWKSLEQPVRPSEDFVSVKCYWMTYLTIYSNLHACVQRVSSVRTFQDDGELSVAVIGFDSLSRLNFMRQMPKTYMLIKSELNGTIMLGFNKVGKNTFPNVIPMLTGSPLHWGPYHHFKGWPLIWNEWEDLGAATMYSEDIPDFNMFDYLADGIEPQPTQHYMRTFWLAVENSVVMRKSSLHCLGRIPKHKVYFSYLQSFFRVYQDSPSFMFTLHNEITHPTINSAGVMDEDLMTFLKSSYEEGLLNRTVVVMLADHGNRFDYIRQTKIGEIEDSMPLVAIILPSWVDKLRPHWRNNLKINARRLTSSYDIYATIREVLSTLVNSSSVRPREPVDEHFVKNKVGGVGLLGSVVKADRNCVDAGVETPYCVCPPEKVETLDVKDPLSSKAIAFILQHINTNLLDGFLHLCSPLFFDKFERVEMRTASDKKRTLHLTFRTSPNGGLYEAFVNLDPPSVASIARINRYGNQSHCITKAVLQKKMYLREVCFCRYITRKH